MPPELPESQYSKGKLWKGNPQDTSRDDLLNGKYPPHLIAKARHFNEQSAEIVGIAADLLTASRAAGKGFISDVIINLVARIQALEMVGVDAFKSLNLPSQPGHFYGPQSGKPAKFVAHKLYALPFVWPGGSCNGMMTLPWSGSGEICLGLYGDVNGKPDALRFQSGEQTVVNANLLVDMTESRPLLGGRYWLALISSVSLEGFSARVFFNLGYSKQGLPLLGYSRRCEYSGMMPTEFGPGSFDTDAMPLVRARAA